MESSNVIEFFNRYTGEVEVERILGEKYIRFAYQTALGRLALHLLVKRALFSRIYGRRMDRPRSAALIPDFVRDYDIDMSEAKRSVTDFGSFNEFFYRELREDVRPVDADPRSIVFPADGRHSGFPDISVARPEYIKACAFQLDSLLGDRELAARFERGTMLVSRLAPVDYHRFHFPLSGSAGASKLINGALYSVNPIAMQWVTDTYLRNKRWSSLIETPDLGTVVMLEIGATNVGCVEYLYQPGRVTKGDVKGYFKFGGSSVVLLFEPGRISLCDDLVEHTRAGRELYAKHGDVAGRLVESPLL
jgi:phosphatidylserine decarboxylase